MDLFLMIMQDIAVFAVLVAIAWEPCSSFRRSERWQRALKRFYGDWLGLM